jgi:hypothetical protein
VNVRIVIAVTIGYVVGAASTIFIFAPFHVRPDLGDVPTWLAVVIAAIGGYVALRQLREQQGQFAEEARRNEKRDILLDTQLAEAAERANSHRRQQAEKITLKRDVIRPGRDSLAHVTNGSSRPIRNVACRLYLDDRAVMPCSLKVGQRPLSDGAWLKRNRSVVFLPAGDDMDLINGLYRDQLAGEIIRFIFPGPTKPDSNTKFLVRFVDDAGARWQLDENMHLEAPPDGDW